MTTTTAIAHSMQTGRSSLGTLWVRCKCGGMSNTGSGVLVASHDVAAQLFERHVNEGEPCSYCETAGCPCGRHVCECHCPEN